VCRRRFVLGVRPAASCQAVKIAKTPPTPPGASGSVRAWPIIASRSLRPALEFLGRRVHLEIGSPMAAVDIDTDSTPVENGQEQDRTHLARPRTALDDRRSGPEILAEPLNRPAARSVFRSG
jgi:hypothetical protein